MPKVAPIPLSVSPRSTTTSVDPAETPTAVPEVVVSRDGFAGKIRVRWYKVTNYAPVDAWVQALAERRPAPLAIVGGWSSDRARDLAEAMHRQAWTGEKPLLLLSTATAETVLALPRVGRSRGRHGAG